MRRSCVPTSIRALILVSAVVAVRVQGQSDSSRAATSDAQRLDPVRVAGRTMCDASTRNREELLDSWSIAQQALSSSQSSSGDKGFSAELVRYTRVLPVDRTGDTTVAVEGTVWNRGDAFATPAIVDLARGGFVRSSNGEVEFVAPDAHQVLSESFAAEYCLWAERGVASTTEVRGLGFRRAATPREGDVEGTLWLSADGRLRSIRYRYVGLSVAALASEPGGEIHFLQLPSGRWIVHRWKLRIPELDIAVVESGVGIHHTARRVDRLRRVVERGGWVTRVALDDADTLTLPGDTLLLEIRGQRRRAASESGPIVTGVDAPGAWDVGRVDSIAIPEMHPGVLRFVVPFDARAPDAAGDTISVLVVPHSKGMRGTLHLPERRATARDRAAVPSRAPTGNLLVVVRSAHDDRPVDAAHLMLGERELRWSPRDSAYAGWSLPSGRYPLRTRRLGFAPDERWVEVAGGAMRLTIRMRPLATLLPEMIVAGKRVVVDPRFGGVVQRALSNWGSVITRGDLRTAYDIQSVMETIPGVRFSPRGITFARCADELPFTASPPRVQVYVDGVRVTAMDDTPPMQALSFVSPAAIEVVEVYRGVAKIPAEFLNDACAVIAIWTRPP